MPEPFGEYWCVSGRFKTYCEHSETFENLVICAKCKFRMRQFWFFGRSLCGAAFVETKNLITGKVKRRYQACRGINHGHCSHFEAK